MKSKNMICGQNDEISIEPIGDTFSINFVEIVIYFDILVLFLLETY